VISGKVDIGATDNRTYERIPEESRKDLIILAQTRAVPRGVIVVRPGFDQSQLDALKTVFLDMGKDDESAKVLDAFQKTTKFDELPGGPDQALAPIREMVNALVQGKKPKYF
jgi:ABC-type phosphate/phosphonate transport system substrate-binding protein